MLFMIIGHGGAGAVLVFFMAVSPFWQVRPPDHLVQILLSFLSWQVSDNPTAVDDRGPIATRTNTFFTDAESVAKGGRRHWAAVASWT
jgi:hypothetical protein